MMTLSTDMQDAPPEFLRLFREGKKAARAGDNIRAHALFRQAIEIDPYHEQIWLWLASVVKSDEDKRVCFENVLELNPTNPTARQQLRKLKAKAHHAAAEMPPPAKHSAQPRWLLRVVLLWQILAGALVIARLLDVL